AIRREFLRHGQIYQSDVQLNDSGRGPFRLRPESHRLDEFAASYSSAGCTPAVPASASPAGFYVPSASRNCKPPLDQGWGIFNRHNEEFSTGVDTGRAGPIERGSKWLSSAPAFTLCQNCVRTRSVPIAGVAL